MIDPCRRGERGEPGESGQAMAEYAIVVAAVVSALIFAGFSFMPEFIRSLQRYYDSYYILINLPIP